MPVQNPFPIQLPSSRKIGTLSTSMDSLIRNVAWELGERYQAVLVAEPHPLGPGWLDRLSANRGDKLSLHDATFVFGEPEFHLDSVTWRALPESPEEHVKYLTWARVTRNNWTHNTLEQNFGTFKQGVQRIESLVNEFGLNATTGVGALLKRIATIQADPNFREQSLEEKQVELEHLMIEEQRKNADLQRQLTEAVRKGGAQEAELQSLVAQLTEQLAAGEEKYKAQLDMLHAQLREARLKTVEPAEGLKPGEAWQGPLGVRVLTLRPLLGDLYDPENLGLLSDELGDVARGAVERWSAFLPHGGPVHLTGGGHAAAQVGTGYIYLGRLDEGASREGMLMVTPSADHEYEVHSDDVIEVETAARLSSRVGPEAARAAARALGGSSRHPRVLRTTATGELASHESGAWRAVGDRPPDWFPEKRDMPDRAGGQPASSE